MRALAILGAALAIALAIGACSLLDDPPPENFCDTSEDCFRAQGEVCNIPDAAPGYDAPTSGRCEPQMDAGIDAP